MSAQVCANTKSPNFWYDQQKWSAFPLIANKSKTPTQKKYCTTTLKSVYCKYRLFKQIIFFPIERLILQLMIPF